MKLLRIFLISYTLATPELQRLRTSITSLYENYWQTFPDVNSTVPLGFFFSCGQIGNAGPNSTQSSCRCDHNAACANCYRWWDGLAMELISNVGIFTENKANEEKIFLIQHHSPYNSRWPVDCSYIDDFSWYTLAYLRVYEWLGEEIYLNEALGLFNWTWTFGWDDECGGVVWNTCQRLKNSITLLEMMSAASQIAFLQRRDNFSHPINFTKRALKLNEWFESFPLFDDRGLVAAGAGPSDGYSNSCCNKTHSMGADKPKCVISAYQPGYSYNQGLYLSSMAYLYRITGNDTFAHKGEKLMRNILTHMTNAQGIFIDDQPNYPTYIDTCRFDQDPGGDWYSFKGVLLTHMVYFMELMPLNRTFMEEIASHIRNSSDNLWNHSESHSSDDKCGGQFLNSTSTLKRFPWEWHKGSKPAPGPPAPPTPDKSDFFRIVNARCYADTEYKVTMEQSEDTCKANCARDSTCHIYQFCEQCKGEGWSQNCWLFKADRTTYNCEFDAYDQENMVIGAKRPEPQDTCKKDCQSSGTCKCDADCATFLDCCLDFASECGDPTAACTDFCESYSPLAISGGGYCFCVDDQEQTSMQICPDYATSCSGPDPYSAPNCLDARSQISAASLFLADYFISEKLNADNLSSENVNREIKRKDQFT